jgi:hypothetical protein
MLEVYYDDDKIRVNNQYLKPSGPPSGHPSKIKYPFQSGKMYTLIMHDPDAPVGNVIHWVVVNMTSTSAGEEIKKYRGPAPPPGSGIHRYIFLLYEQQEEETGREIVIPNVLPMEELLELLKLQDSRLVSTNQFTSSSSGVGGRRKRRSRKKKRKSSGSLKRSMRKKRSTLYPNPNPRR